MGWVILLMVLAVVGLGLASFLRFGVWLDHKDARLHMGWFGHRVHLDLRKRLVDWWWLSLHLLHRPLPKRKPVTRPKKPRNPPSLSSVWKLRPKTLRLGVRWINFLESWRY